MADILIIDDDPVMCDLLAQLMKKNNHQSVSSLTGAQGLELAKAGSFDIIFLDVNLPDVNGMDLIHTLKQVPSIPEIIIITGERDPDGAELAIKSGAWNYMEKPFFRQEINLQIKRALEFRKEKGRVSESGGLKRHNIIGESDLIIQCLDEAGIAARSDVHVLITGKRGTGKTEFAKTIHLNSRQWENHFVVVDCAALNETIARNILFGSEEQGRPGLVALADKGTLLLDDVEKLPMGIQEPLVRAMQGKHGWFKVIATTSLSSQELERGNLICKDLYRAVNQIRIRVPELNRRGEDILSLLMYYLEHFCKKYKVPNKGISPECLALIQSYSWPGNVRELIQAVGKTVAIARQEPTLYSIHLPAYIRTQVLGSKERPGQTHDFKEETLKCFLENRERAYLSQLYRYTDKDVEKACEIAGISKSGFYKKIKKYSLI